MHRGSIKPEQIRLVTHDEAYDNKERGVAHVREEAETCLVLTDSWDRETAGRPAEAPLQGQQQQLHVQPICS